jgi:hypothetical protein
MYKLVLILLVLISISFSKTVFAGDDSEIGKKLKCLVIEKTPIFDPDDLQDIADAARLNNKEKFTILLLNSIKFTLSVGEPVYLSKVDSIGCAVYSRERGEGGAQFEPYCTDNFLCTE